MFHLCEHIVVGLGFYPTLVVESSEEPEEGNGRYWW